MNGGQQKSQYNNKNEKSKKVKQGEEITSAVGYLADGVKPDMLSYVSKNSSSAHDYHEQGVELGVDELEIPEEQDPIPASDKPQGGKKLKNKTTKNKKGTFLEKASLQTVTYGLGLYALWNNCNLLVEEINAVRKGITGDDFNCDQ